MYKDLDSEKIFQERLAKQRKAEQILQILDIPMNTKFSVLSVVLVDILMDEEKMKEINSKLNCKAFW